MSVRSLRHLVSPERVVAVAPVGATPAWARRLGRNLFGGDFAGERLAVGPLEGAPAVAVLPDLASLPAGGPFLALVALPQPDAVGLLGRLHARSCRGAILVGGGLGPLALSPADRQALQGRARELGLRVLGPTRAGLVVPRLGLNAGAAAGEPPRAGDLAFLTQSDAITSSMLDWAAPRGLGFSLVASLGDSADVRVDDFLDLLALDVHTRAVLLHLEGVSDARRFMSAARAAARTKPVVVIRAGRYAAAGPGLGGDHAEAEALRDEAYDAAFRRAGMLRVRDVEDLFASAATLAHGAAARRTRLRSGRVAIVANGRGPALLAADALGRGGGRLAAPSPETLHAVALALGPVEGPGNPLDLGLEAGPDAFAAAIPPLLRDPGCDAVLVLVAPGAVEAPERYAAAIAGLERQAREGRRLLAAAFLGEATVAGARKALAEARVPAYATPEEAVRALLDLAAFERRQQALREVPPAEPLEGRPHCGPVRALVRHALAAGRRELAPGELVRLLDAYELPPPGTGEGRGGVEVVMRMRVDATFGPVLRVAQGGPGDALIGEAASGLPPLNRALAEAMLEETALGRLLLAGGDARLPDPAYLVDALVRLSRLVVDRPEVAAVGLELRLSREAGLETLRAAVALEPAADDADPAARLAVRPYPVELEEVVGLRDGTRVRLRPIRPEDAPALQRAFRRMSPEDARLRLFGPARELMPELAARLTQIDYDREMALVAEDPADPAGLIGGARVTMDADGRRAEFAVTVRSDQKRRGLGRIALSRVLEHARSRGVEEVWGEILAENRPMIGLARSLGFEVGRDPDEPEAVVAVRRL